jgi:integrase
VKPQLQATLAALHTYLKGKKLRKETAFTDRHFTVLLDKLFSELKSEHGLKEYRCRERLEYETQQFNFIKVADEFVDFKRDTSVPMKHDFWLKKFWLPFFKSQGCQHPRDFKRFKGKARRHMREATKINSDERYSVNTYVSMTNTLNEFMQFLVDEGHIEGDDDFDLMSKVTREQRKRNPSLRQRGKDVYSLDELFEIKRKIDVTYTTNLEMKLRAYGLLAGVYSGLRRGNVLGLKARHLHPEGEPDPYLETADNHVDGWSRGEKGVVIIEDATKMDDESYEIPLVLPSRETFVEVCRFLKENLAPEAHIVACHPSTVADWWKAIAGECGFRFIKPHGWKHSYATIGAENMHFFANDVYLLHHCCMHESFQTTLKYVNQKKDRFRKAFHSAHVRARAAKPEPADRQ